LSLDLLHEFTDMRCERREQRQRLAASTVA
jgi:hypothetical protein